MNKIKEALTKIFDRHRIVFWYNAKKELRVGFEELDLPGVEKIELRNNEFGVKYRILREQPKQKFLLYHEGPKPDNLDNWLLDVLLAYDEFRTDKSSLWLSELELGLEFTDVIESHADFFHAAKRRAGLKNLLKPNDTHSMIRMKMLAVCTTSEPRIDEILESLLAELADNRDDKFKLLQRCGLDVFLWGQLKSFYGYESESPGVRDFAIELFKSCYAMGTDGNIRLSGDALVFLKRWKDSIRHHRAFEVLSDQYAEVLNIEQDLQSRDYRQLVELDYFRLIDQKILSDLVKGIVNRTITSGQCAGIVRQRRQNHWYKEYEHLYEAANYAAQFIHTLNATDLTMDSMTDGIERYSRFWFKLDQLYRKVIFHIRKSGQTSIMKQLVEQIENLYSNNYLLTVNDNWQQVIDAADRWGIPSLNIQRRFFDNLVRPFLQKKKKVCVIISDALRFEVGDELLGLIQKEDRYEAKLEPYLSMLPSYTQLGMAALLPNSKLSFAENGSGIVFVNERSSQGTENRKKILKQAVSQRATAIRSEDLWELNKEDSRLLIREHDVVYIYHNRIDSTGDKRESEEQVFEAVEETLLELVKIIKKLTGANANNLLITTDHGFIFQNRAIDESDFSGADVSGDQVLLRDRRFVLGKGLLENPGFKKFSAKDIGLEGDVEIQIPKSINRLRLQGAGSRYVHGGASLQEVVIPVIQINKKRQSDVTKVEVEILRGATSVITSGQLGVVFYQTQAAGDKVQHRRLRTGIYTQAGKLISDRHELIFDMASENPRDREMQVRFILTREADQANGQEVFLKLEEKLQGTSHYREYKSIKYLIRRSFTSDFDF